MGNVLQLKSNEFQDQKIFSDVDIQVSHHNNCNNSNNTKVTEETFPLSKQKTVTSEEDSPQPPQSDLEALADDTSPTSSEEVADKSVIKQAWRLEVGKASSGKKPHGIPTSPLRLSGVTSVRSAVFEKWAARDRDTQRPLAKRQLSDESKAHTSSRVKRTVLKRERAEGGQVLIADNNQRRQTESLRGPQAALKSHATCRKLQRELFVNTDVFQKVDAHAIKTGKEVTKKRHMPKCSCLCLCLWCFADDFVSL